MIWNLTAEIEADSLADALAKTAKLPQGFGPEQIGHWLKSYRLSSVMGQDGTPPAVIEYVSKLVITGVEEGASPVVE